MTDCKCNGPGYCQRHGTYKTAHWVKLCRTNENYFRAWEAGKGPGQRNPPITVNNTIVKDKITILVTEHKRPESLARLLHSIERYAPDLNVLVQPTHGNLSRARNLAVKKVRTPYFLLCEDDFEFTSRTSLSPLLQIVEHDSEIVGAGGLVVTKGRNKWHHCFAPFRGEQRAHISNMPWRFTPSGVSYQPCHLIENFGVFRTDVVREIPWDEELELAEHREWFWRLHTKWLVAYCPTVQVQHWIERPSEDYNRDRKRASQFRKLAEKKIGMKMPPPETFHPREKPNIIVLGIGHCNTTITTQQLFALGWERNDADDEYAESNSVRAINKAIVANQSYDSIEACLAELREPWAIKDPRFCTTLVKWLPHLEPYQPLLLWIQKDERTVRESFRRRGESQLIVDRRKKAVIETFNNWPWAKVTVRAEYIADAIRLFRR